MSKGRFNICTSTAPRISEAQDPVHGHMITAAAPAPTFVADDKFVDACAALQRRGWRRCAHLHDPTWCLKWRNFSRIRFETLRAGQIVNHVENANELSNKGKLCCQLRQLHRRLGINAQHFFPRTWLLGNEAHAKEFIAFAAVDRARAVLAHAIGALHLCRAEIECNDNAGDEELGGSHISAAASAAALSASVFRGTPTSMMVQTARTPLSHRIVVALAIATAFARRHEQRSTVVGSCGHGSNANASCDCDRDPVHGEDGPCFVLQDMQNGPMSEDWRVLFASSADAARTCGAVDRNANTDVCAKTDAAAAICQTVDAEIATVAAAALFATQASDVAGALHLLDDALIQVQCSDAQASLTRAGQTHPHHGSWSFEPEPSVWVLKPTTEACGRGVQCMALRSPEKLLFEALRLNGNKSQGSSDRHGHARDRKCKPEIQAVVQKYIERPLLVRGHKFDVRQWVLLTTRDNHEGHGNRGDGGFDVWWWNSPYVRFALTPFVKANAGESSRNDAIEGNEVDYSDRFAHLCNHAVQQYNQAGQRQRDTQHEFEHVEQKGGEPADGDQGEGEHSDAHPEPRVPRMWTAAALSAFLRERDAAAACATAPGDALDVDTGTTIPCPWSERVVPAIRHACVSTLEAVCTNAAGSRRLRPPQHGAKAFEWLGFDIMLDEALNPWVLEVNVSPDMSHSTDVTAALVPAATEQVLKIVLGELPHGAHFSSDCGPRWERILQGMGYAGSREHASSTGTRGKTGAFAEHNPRARPGRVQRQTSGARHHGFARERGSEGGRSRGAAALLRSWVAQT